MDPVITCPTCGALTSEEPCWNCGGRVRCASCGAAVNGQFCESCGQPTGSGPATPAPTAPVPTAQVPPPTVTPAQAPPQQSSTTATTSSVAGSMRASATSDGAGVPYQWAAVALRQHLGVLTALSAIWFALVLVGFVVGQVMVAIGTATKLAFLAMIASMLSPVVMLGAATLGLTFLVNAWSDASSGRPVTFAESVRPTRIPSVLATLVIGLPLQWFSCNLFMPFAFQAACRASLDGTGPIASFGAAITGVFSSGRRFGSTLAAGVAYGAYTAALIFTGLYFASVGAASGIATSLGSTFSRSTGGFNSFGSSSSSEADAVTIVLGIGAVALVTMALGALIFNFFGCVAAALARQQSDRAVGAP